VNHLTFRDIATVAMSSFREGHILLKKTPQEPAEKQKLNIERLHLEHTTDDWRIAGPCSGAESSLSTILPWTPSFASEHFSSYQ